jgi:tetratricopeptide (TPR) repeat protein
MRSARQYMNAGRYDEAAQSLAEALHAQPDDAAALALQKNAVAFGCIARAESLGKQGDYISAIKELTHALEVLPENARAKQMLADFNRQAPEQRARLEREHIEAWTNTFKGFTEKITGAALVEMHEMKTSKSAKEVQTSIVEQFHSVSPEFNLTHVGWTNDVFYMDANQEVSGGGRLCMIVGGQINDNETRIAFKVVEFKSEAIGLRILGAVLANATSTTYQSNFKPINPADEKLSASDKNRVSEGIRIVTEKIERAIK